MTLNSQLSELVHARLEGLHVHDVSLIEEDLTAKYLVLGGGVSLELEASKTELVALENLQVHIDDVVFLLGVIRIDVGVDVSAMR